MYCISLKNYNKSNYNIIYILLGHDTIDSVKGQYHCHSTDKSNHHYFHRNEPQRKSTTCEENRSMLDKLRQNKQNVSGGPSHSQFSYPIFNSKTNGYSPWPAYATVQVRQRHNRTSILPPGAIGCNGHNIDTNGGTIRRYSSVQLRSKPANSSKGRI